MKKDPYAVKYSHGKKITIRPVDGGFVVERYLKGEQVFVDFEEVVSELYEWCYGHELGAQCKVSFEIAEWAEGKA
mgnify:CR=1 FL=1|tara:strand:+ start:1835 stop:2059 length:225 start_codon:yes stop_codon:yes gene_type:complete